MFLQSKHLAMEKPHSMTKGQLEYSICTHEERKNTEISEEELDLFFLLAAYKQRE